MEKANPSSTTPLKDEEALLEVAEATQDIRQKHDSDVKSSDTREEMIEKSKLGVSLRLDPNVNEHAFEETNGDKDQNESIKKRKLGASFQFPAGVYEQAFQEMDEEVEDNQLVARKGTDVAANVEFQKDYKEHHRRARLERTMLQNQTHAGGDVEVIENNKESTQFGAVAVSGANASAMSPLRNQISRDDDDTDTDDESIQPGAVAVSGFRPDNQDDHNSRNDDSDNETTIKAELVPDKEGMEEAIREEVRKELLQELIQDAVRAEVVGSNLDEDVEAQVPADEERKSHRLFWLCCDCRIAVIVVDILTIINIAVADIGNNETYNADGSFISFDENGTVVYSIKKVSIGVLVGFWVFTLVCMISGILGALKFNWPAVTFAFVYQSLAFILACVIINESYITWTLFCIYPHLVLISEIRHGIMTEERYQIEKYCCCCCKSATRSRSNAAA